MDSLEKKTLTTSRGLTYTYYTSDPAKADASRPVLLFQHGFPDHAHMWDSVLAKLPACYRVIVPDLLGYAGTSKPADYHAFRHKLQTTDLVEILDAEKVPKVISIGHDWGSVVAQRLWIWHPERVSGVVMINLAYTLPRPQPVSIDDLNNTLEAIFGYRPLEYQKWLVANDKAAQILQTHADRLYDGLHGAESDWLKKFLGDPGSMEKFLTNPDGNWNVEVRDYAKDPKAKRDFVERFQRDGFDSPLNYYRANSSDINRTDEVELPKQRLVMTVPALFVACTQDSVCRPEFIGTAIDAGCLPDLETVVLDCAHWSPLEKSAEVADGIDAFLTKKFPTAANI